MRFTAHFLLILGFAAVGAVAITPTAAHARTVIDMAGRQVEIPDHIHRVACLEVLCYPRMFMLGADDRVVTLYATATPWMTATNPRVSSIPSFQGDANIEVLAALKTEIAFIRYNPEQALPQLRAVGIAALVSQPYPRDPDSPEAFNDAMKRMVRLYGDVLGGEAAARAEDWCTYYDERIRFITNRVADIPADHRVRVYYVRGPDALSTQGWGGYTYWSGRLAGADMVADRAVRTGKGAVSMEDIIKWNPQVILVGRQYPLGLVLDDPRWRDISAVRDKRVVSTPEGVWYWDGGPELILHTQFLAKTIYPDRFADFDMKAELKAYYARFYRVRLSDGDAVKILAGQSPDGSRFNPANN